MNIRRKRILVLAADERVLTDLQESLEHQGFDTTASWDAAEAMQFARTRQFDLLLIGDHPWQVTSSEILKELQCSRVSIPCVILQAKDSTFDSEYFYSLGASGVISHRKLYDIARWVQDYFDIRAAAAGNKAG